MGSKTAAIAASVLVATIKVLLDFKSYSEKLFGPFLAKVLKCATNNPYLKAPDEIMADCQAKYDAYIASLTNRDANPSPANTSFLEAAYVQAGDSFEKLAIWVQDNCNGDRGIVLSFGFKLAKATKTAATLLPTPSDVSYEYGMPGCIVFKCKSFGRGVRYIVEHSTDGGQTWTICGVSTKSRLITAQGLVRGKEYIFRIYGQNEAGDGKPWTSGGIVAAV